MPLVELLTSAALGLSLQLLHEAIIRAKERSLITRCILDRLDATLHKITPFVIKIDTLTEESMNLSGKSSKSLKVFSRKPFVSLMLMRSLNSETYSGDIGTRQESRSWTLL
uniref:HR1 n=1 Tax=Arabidopsis thaliana TaxID=3702 RepID=A0A514YDJ4_ARATH|nr:HR1 [Arabidopsis thaliana]